MPHYKRAAAPKTSSPPFLPYCALSVLLLRHPHVQAHVLGRVLLQKEHGLVTADLDEESLFSMSEQIRKSVDVTVTILLRILNMTERDNIPSTMGQNRR